MPIHRVKGDATTLSAIEDEPNILHVLPHICNNRGGWGKGYCLAISKICPGAEISYRDWHSSGDLDGVEFKLGNVNWALNFDKGGKREGSLQVPVHVINMIAQDGYSTLTKPAINYDALRLCLAKVAQTYFGFMWGMGFSLGLRTGIPLLFPTFHVPRLMGCGLASGQQEIVEEIINDTIAKRFDVYSYELEK